MPEDWQEEFAKRRVRSFAGHLLLRQVSVQGQACLARIDVLRHHVDLRRPGFPVNQNAMTYKGFVNGFPAPPLFAHNMDDPRSPHFREDGSGMLGPKAGFTARRQGFTTWEEYVSWIEADARRRQRLPFGFQRLEKRIANSGAPASRVARRVWRILRRRLDAHWAPGPGTAPADRISRTSQPVAPAVPSEGTRNAKTPGTRGPRRSEQLGRLPETK
jgi:hypothetical protein